MSVKFANIHLINVRKPIKSSNINRSAVVTMALHYSVL